MLKWQIGEVSVTQIVELSTASLGPYLLPQADPGALLEIPWLRPFVDENGRIVLSVHALVVESQGERLIVDTCIGNDKERSYPRWNRMQTDFLDRLSQAGYPPETIDAVMCTHMHVDHVGWNTRLTDDGWVPTFAGARYLFAEDEWAYWQREPQEFGPVVEDSVQPIFDAGLDHVFTADHVSFHNGNGMDGIVNAATLCALDPRAHVVIGVYLLALRHPVTVARQLSTLATNALIERRGAKVGVIATAGFRDVLEIAYERRYDQYDLYLEKQDMIVPRDRVKTVRERIDAGGRVIEALDVARNPRSGKVMIAFEGA